MNIMINKKRERMLSRLEFSPANRALALCSYLRLFLYFLTAYPTFRHSFTRRSVLNGF
jgi:hypothetical protein